LQVAVPKECFSFSARLESALELCRQGLVAGYFPAFVACEHNKRINADYHLERRRAPTTADCKLKKSDVFLVKWKSTVENAFS
jgi:hypothetical protein